MGSEPVTAAPEQTPPEARAIEEALHWMRGDHLPNYADEEQFEAAERALAALAALVARADAAEQRVTPMASSVPGDKAPPTEPESRGAVESDTAVEATTASARSSAGEGHRANVAPPLLSGSVGGVPEALGYACEAERQLQDGEFADGMENLGRVISILVDA